MLTGHLHTKRFFILVWYSFGAFLLLSCFFLLEESKVIGVVGGTSRGLWNKLVRLLVDVVHLCVDVELIALRNDLSAVTLLLRTTEDVCLLGKEFVAMVEYIFNYFWSGPSLLNFY